MLDEFVRLDATVRQWHDPSFEPTLRDFQRRFAESDSEEGTVMAATLAYVIEDLRLSRRNAILGEFRTSTRILRLFDQGRREPVAPVRRKVTAHSDPFRSKTSSPGLAARAAVPCSRARRSWVRTSTISMSEVLRYSWSESSDESVSAENTRVVPSGESAIGPETRCPDATVTV